MYENQTEEVILKRMLSNVPPDTDKREGSVIYDSTMPAAIEFMLVYAMCDYFLKNTFGDTAERLFLVERAKERGLAPKAASCAVAKGMFMPMDIQIPIGARFSYDDVNYAVTEKISNGVFLLKCESAGIVGNKPAGSLIAIDYIAGLQSARLSEITIPGEDEESTESFRTRYLASFDSQAYGGNIADYREKVNAIAGVGGVKVYPVWAGGGTVRIAFMTSEFAPPTAEFIAKVQNMIDPVGHSGEGVGIAPVGHHVTVHGVANSQIAIGLHLSFSTGSYDQYKTAIESAIDTYFLSLNKGWQGTQIAEVDNVSNVGITVRISQIESRLLDISGVSDVQHTTLNGLEENLTLGVDQLAVRGVVTNGS